MDDLISRQVALDALGVTKNATKYGGDHSGYDTRMLYEIHDALTGIPAADVVPVVRCKDCIHWSDSNQCARPELSGSRWHGPKYFDTYPDDFCSYGERKE